MENPPVNAGDAGDVGWLPLSGRFPGGENGNPLQHSCQENHMDRGAWWVSAHGAAKSRTQLSTHTHTHTHTHSDILQSRNYDLFMFVLSVMPDTEKCLSFKNLVTVY